VISDVSGGRNGYDPPWKLKPNECADAVDVEFWQAPLGRPRQGSVAIGMTFSAGGPVTAGKKILWVERPVPGTDETAAELWAADDAATPIVGRLAGATTWTAPTLKDAITGNVQDMCGASANGRLFIAYGSGQGRLHCWDGSTVRRTGLAATAAPTVA